MVKHTKMKSVLLSLIMLMFVDITGKSASTSDDFVYNDVKFADIEMLRYKVEDFERLSAEQRIYIYYLSEAALWGRDILFDQNGAYNLRIRRMLEALYLSPNVDKEGDEGEAMVEYLRRVWFSSGIHHHYGSGKFVPGFSREWLQEALLKLSSEELETFVPRRQSLEDFEAEIFPVIFDPTVMPMRVNQTAGEDLLLTSGENYYGKGVTQAEAEEFYNNMRDPNDARSPMWGLNSRLVKESGVLKEIKWTTEGLYGEALRQVVKYLELAEEYAETSEQQDVIEALKEYYRTGDLELFDEYNIKWLQETGGSVDFVNGFTEVYGDPLGLKASWESIVNFKNVAATQRTEKLSANAQWFEDHSPVDKRFKKKECKGISAKVITAAMLAGDLYPSTAIGINLPNSNWIRKEYGSKSVTIGNLTDAYNKAAKGNGFRDEFVRDPEVKRMMDEYGELTDNLHTDLHECLGHGSGQLLPGVSDDSLRAYGSTIEEGRADLFALYYLADPKLVELGLTPNENAYKAEYYAYMLNGLLTQLVRIKPGDNIEEAHMRNRSFIAHWVLEHGREDNIVELTKTDGKTQIVINDYEALRKLFGQLLAEVQRIKSEGDFAAARDLVETYGVKVDQELLAEVLERYEKLGIKPYKGFINPRYIPQVSESGELYDVKIDYTEGYDEQMLRYSREYSPLPLINE